MTPTTIPSERSLSFIFTTFADVARHASRTRWHPVSSSSEMSFLSLICSSLPSLQQLGPAAHLTFMWGSHDSSVPYLQQRLWGDRDRGEGRGAGSRARTGGGPRGPRARSGWRGHGLLCGRPGALDETHLSLPPPPPRGRAPPMGGAVGGPWVQARPARRRAASRGGGARW